MTEKKLQENLRNFNVATLKEYLTERGEDVVQIASNKLAFPTLDDEQNDQYIVITVSVPTGSKDGEGFDCYEQADEYTKKLVAQQEREQKAQAEKKRKIAQQEKSRQKRKEVKERREQEKQEN